MHILAIALLTILAGTLLLAKSQKDMPGKFFAFISWFFIVVGFLLFIGSIVGGICRITHHRFGCHHNYRCEMMMKDHHCCQREMMEKTQMPGMQGGCSEQAPAPVKQAFMNMFPAATDVKYEMERGDYEVNFKDKGVEMSANFNASGNWLETETEIKESDLPKVVSASVARNYAGFKMSEVAKIEKPDKGLCYEMDLKNDKEGYEVQFSSKGDVLKKEPLKKEKEEVEKEK